MLNEIRDLEPTDVAILREAVRLNGLTAPDANRINVGVVQLEELVSRGLLTGTSGVFHANAIGRTEVNE